MKELAIDKANKLIAALEKEADGLVVHGLIKAYLVGSANAFDAKQNIKEIEDK